jgi:hypothetical protein
MIIKPLGTEIDIGSTANTVDNAKLVRIINTSGSSNHVANVSFANGTVYTSITLSKDETILLEKDPTDKVLGPNMKAISIAFRH